MKKRGEMTRQEADKNFQWKLSDIFATDDAYEAKFEETKALVESFSKYEGNVGENIGEVLKANFYIELSIIQLYAYAKMNLDGDTGNTGAQSMEGKAYNLYVNFASASAFLKPELLMLDESILQNALKDESLQDYYVYLRKLIREKAHTLSYKEEKLMAMMGDSAATAENAFTMLTDADMEFPEVTDTDGSKVKLTEPYYGKLIEDDNRDVRKEAFETLFETYGKYKNTIAATYGGSVKNDKFVANARGFNSCVEASLYYDEIPLKVYDNLVEVINESIPYLNDYLKLRKDVLDYEELHMYDLYATIVKDVKWDMSYDEAFDNVIAALGVLGDDYTATLNRAKNEGWIDVYENKGKASGAYSFGVYGVHPYILLNHNDDLNSCMTLAHELGHTMHSWYSDNAQPFAKSDYSLFVAEVASTVNEVLLLKHLLNKTESKEKKAYLLNYFLEQFRTIMFRQTMFAEFERISHSLAEKGETLTHEVLSNEYYNLNKKYYGEICNVDELIAIEWARIPHFYRAFYVFVYSTGFAAAVYLANKILSEGASAVESYKKFLSAGGSVPPLDALRMAGVDMENPEVIRNAMATFKETIDDLRNIIK
ncbi:MAG: oligoendopeptidase F [Christensenellaceae bacterium]|nr:oligoendopeptidase F [Christensenellaceae bacterium]